MTVQEHDRIDQLAVGMDGGLLLAMTEDRTYGSGADADLTEDFRLKLNSYVGAVQSGEVLRMAEKAGIEGIQRIEIVFFSANEPPPTVFEMLNVVNSKLGVQGISARWEPLDIDEITPEVYEQAVVAEASWLLAQATPGWRSARLWVSLIGDWGGGVIRVVCADHTEVDVELPDVVRGLLLGHKQATYEEAGGAWLSGWIDLTGTERYYAKFSWDSLPGWGVTRNQRDFLQELADYPRADYKVPLWMRELLVGC
ncbi:hypothetical protein AB0H76_31465 [Nocardia sp. NPDC050712]|uniref:hypothetical protein n=1 Tax=Nocardia sp. NPDC050712 TaxID=3155518 RepID=UPI0033FB41DE